MPIRTTQTLSRELYGSSRTGRPVAAKPQGKPRPSMRKHQGKKLTPEYAQGLPQINSKADEFFKGIKRCQDEDIEPPADVHANIQATIAEFTAELRRRHLEEMRKGGSDGVKDVEFVSDWDS
jgi:hypothetical protein